MNREEGVNRGTQCHTSAAGQYDFDHSYPECLKSLKVWLLTGIDTHTSALDRADSIKAIALRLEQHLQIHQPSIQLEDMDDQMTETEAGSDKQTEELKFKSVLMLALSYLDTELYRLTSLVPEQLQYRRKYSRALASAIAQLRIRMLFDEEIFESFLLEVLRELKQLSYGTEFTVFLKKFVAELELECEDMFFQEIQKTATPLKTEAASLKQLHTKSSAASAVSSSFCMEEETKLQTETELVKPMMVTFRHMQAPNGRTLFYRPITHKSVRRR